ncbi:hypothetical protein PP556_14525 [Mycobacteroides abscessus]|nr:hypothetical protein [Mycobacteroides abscessus]MDM2451144.1 hypothetical protein [Mycobacteroides abscessus]MDM2455710.1 hypothetical protein [Mycobacteroides abscessus]MDM2460462.1 hypothetical protein [Mycobacteroides abscessus]MDM2466106.1 hypothetical protein [Mycobacteroides abscessus]
MSAAKAGTYVLAASAFYRVEGEGDEKVRRRYKRGDKVALSKAEAARLTVGSRLAPASFVKADDAEVDPGDDLATAPEGAVNRESEANQLQAEANTGLNTQQGLDESAAIPTTDGAPDGSPTGDGRPAKSATVEVWKAYAVQVEAVTEEEAGNLTKAALQEAVARKVGG